ncbi:unnamed protein product [Parajaminaea phylloscopi]
MVQTYSVESSFPLPWPVLAHAYFLRYPNPFAQHVLSLDVLDRRILRRTTDDPPVLLTSRLLLKKGTLPSWAPRGLIKNAESWVLEVTEVELEESSTRPQKGRQMRTWTRNLDHTTVLAVAEGLTFREEITSAMIAQPPVSETEEKSPAASIPQTHCVTSAHITSDVSVLWKRIEKFGLKRFKAHMDTSRQGLLYAASHLSDNRYPHSLSLPAAPTPIAKLREALRPPWLDGLPISPFQRARRFLEERIALPQRYRTIKEEGLWGYTGRQEREDGMRRWREELRERLVRFRQGRKGVDSQADPALPAESQPAASDPRDTAVVPPPSNHLAATSPDTASRALAESSNTVLTSPPSGDREESVEVQRERLARLMHELRNGKQPAGFQTSSSSSYGPK